MRLTAIGAAIGLMVLAGCDSTAEPAQPPTQEDALTTATATPAPTTPSDEVDATTEAAPTTEEPTETQEEPDGPPELPEEATEQTEEGAEAFAIHYLEMVNYTGRYPEEGLLEPLAAEGCKSCANHEEAVAYGVEYGDYLLEDTFVLGAADTIFTGEGARVSIPITQPEQTFYRDDEPIDRVADFAEATLIVRVTWDDAWAVSEITVEQ